MKRDYYGTDSNTAVSYLEFGSINLEESSKTIWGYWQDQEAYDLYMFARYARDLFSFREFIKNEEEHSIDGLLKRVSASAHDKLLDYIFKYAGFVTEKSGGWQCECGSSIYGLVEELIACDIVFNNGKRVQDITKGKYIASDISKIMNDGAVALHPEAEMTVSTAPTTRDFINEMKGRGVSLDLFYGLSVSMRYALRETSDLIDMADICGLQIYNRLSLSRDETYSKVYGTGKAVYIVSLKELIREVREKGLTIKYNTANMQYDKDGEGSVRASIAISRESQMVEDFISEYDRCIDFAKQTVPQIEKGLWRDLGDLV